ncbi:MAG: response regulator transcription factor [Burkholderiaceae bacterium]
MRVLVVDDHPLVVDAITTAIGALEPGVVVETASSVEEISRLEGLGAPDLVLLDLTLPGSQGLDALAGVLRVFPSATVVIFSATQDAETIARALRSGAKGFIPKTSSHRVLLDALQLVLNGGTYVPPDILGNLGAAMRSPAPMLPPAAPLSGPGAAANSAATAAAVQSLTERQRQIAELLAEGLTTKEICRRLNISPNTVKTHVASIFRALGVSNRAQIVAVTHLRLRNPLQ